MLVQFGDTITPFSRDDQVVEIRTPGKIYFCANDECTPAGADKFKELLAGPRGKAFADAIILPPYMDGKVNRFSAILGDNRGGCCVTLCNYRS